MPPPFPLLNRANTIAHPQLSVALKKLRRLVSAADDTRIAFLLAPTGCGKSFIAYSLLSEIADEEHKLMKKDLAYLPVAYVEIRLLAGQKQFNWEMFYERLLEALKHPFPKSGNLADARGKLRTVLADRKTKVVIIDEAHHVISGYSEVGIRSQSEALKSLGQEFKVTWVFVGTYDLNPVVRYNGQMARRGRVVHMQRYRNIGDDRKTFLKVLSVLDDELRDFLRIRLVECDELIYSGCLGLVGVLRDWLVRAYENSTQESEPGITIEALGETELDLLSRKIILEEVKDGEREQEVTDDDKRAFSLLLRDDVSERGAKEESEERKSDKPSGGRRKQPRSHIGRTKRRHRTNSNV